jgi:hypothetical protein
MKIPWDETLVMVWSILIEVASVLKYAIKLRICSVLDGG